MSVNSRHHVILSSTSTDPSLNLLCTVGMRFVTWRKERGLLREEKNKACYVMKRMRLVTWRKEQGLLREEKNEACYGISREQKSMSTWSSSSILAIRPQQMKSSCIVCSLIAAVNSLILTVTARFLLGLFSCPSNFSSRSPLSPSWNPRTVWD